MSNNKYIYIKCLNTSWILNRISSLIRRKKYNMDQVNISFDNEWYANILVEICSENKDEFQMINQIEKLHDVLYAKDVSNQKNDIYIEFYVYTNSLDTFCDIQPSKILKSWNKIIWIFIIDLLQKDEFSNSLIQKKLKYSSKIISLIN